MQKKYCITITRIQKNSKLDKEEKEATKALSRKPIVIQLLRAPLSLKLPINLSLLNSKHHDPALFQSTSSPEVIFLVHF